MRLAAALAILGAFSACRQAPSKPVEQPVQALEGFTVTQSDHGTKIWSMDAADARVAEEAKQVTATEPKLRFFQHGREVTEVTAKVGVMNTDTSDVRLSSSVVVRSLEENSVLKTDELLWDSHKYKFLTDREVSVTRPGGVLHGKGMESDAKLTEIKIFHQTSVIDKGAVQ